MDIKQVFSDEIRRLARKEIKQAVIPLQESINSLKKLVNEQKKQIAALEKRCPEAEVEDDILSSIVPIDTEKNVRLNASGIVRLRNKLGLTQAEFARVLGVAMHTVSVWEQGRRVPRATHKIRICALRKIGKRELKRLLEQSTEVSEEDPKEDLEA